MEDVEAVRKRYFDSAKYLRGDGQYQSMYEFFGEFQSNGQFNWLHQIYTMWHKHRVFMTWHSMVERGQQAGLSKDFATAVADSVYKGCKSFFYVTNSLLVSKDRLIDLCLNDSMYHSVCLQVIHPLTEFHDQLDGFMDELLWGIREEYVRAHRGQAHGGQGHPRKRCSVKDIEAVEELGLQEHLVAHDDAISCLLDEEVDKELTEHFSHKKERRGSIPVLDLLKTKHKRGSTHHDSPPTSSSPSSTKEKITSLFHHISPRRSKR